MKYLPKNQIETAGSKCYTPTIVKQISSMEGQREHSPQQEHSQHPLKTRISDEEVQLFIAAEQRRQTAQIQSETPILFTPAQEEPKVQKRGDRKYTRRGVLGLAGKAAVATAAGVLLGLNLERPASVEAADGRVWECIQELQNDWWSSHEERTGTAYNLENDTTWGWGNHFNLRFESTLEDLYAGNETPHEKMDTHIRVFDHPNEGYTEWRIGKGSLLSPGGDVDTSNPNWFEKIVRTSYSDYTDANGMISLERMAEDGAIGLIEALNEDPEIGIPADLLVLLASAVMDSGGNELGLEHLSGNTQKSLTQNMKDLYNQSTPSCPANMIP